MTKKYKLQDVAQLSGRDIFFDANVLIYLFWPTGQHFFEQNYAKVFKNLLIQKNNLFVDFIVISEVINRILRIEHKKIYPNIPFKEFRNSQQGRAALNDIYIIVKNQILNSFNIIGKGYKKQEIENFMDAEEIDFVDKAIVLLCQEKALVLLTNDKDFRNVDLDILTNNPYILQ